MLNYFTDYCYFDAHYLQDWSESDNTKQLEHDPIRDGGKQKCFTKAYYTGLQIESFYSILPIIGPPYIEPPP